MMEPTADSGFTAREIGRMVRHRNRYLAGRWPNPFTEKSVDESYQVALTATPSSIDNQGMWRCELRASNDSVAIEPVKIAFQTCVESPEAPDAREILRWLGLGVMPHATDLDPTQLAVMFHLMVLGPASGLTYRGPIIEADSIEEFAVTMSNLGAQLTNLIGDDAVRRLVHEIVSAST